MAKPNLTLGTQWLSTSDVRNLLTKARDNRQAQRRLPDSLKDKVAHRRDEIARSLGDLPTEHRSNLINKAIAVHRTDLRHQSEDTRLAYVKEASRYRQATQAAASHYRSSPQMLTRYTLGSERRSRIMQQIAASGPAELASLAELAASTKDLELGAAVCSRLYELDPAKRPFVAAELADMLIGEEFREITQAIKEIDRLALEATTDDTAFETGNAADPRRALEIAMMFADEADHDDDIEEEGI